MVAVKLKDINHGASLLKQIIQKADLNKDGAIRAGDMNKIREHNGVLGPTNGNWNDGSDGAHLVAGINAAVGRAKSRGGPQLAKVDTAIDDFKKLTRAADVNKNGKLEAAEQKKLKTTGEKQFLTFVVWARSKTLSDIDLPAQQGSAPSKPKFKWSGTPAEVCTSLLASTSDPKNDNFWPAWANGPGPARYVVTTAEAKAMVKALSDLYVSRQKAVITELAERTHSSSFGCVSPNDAAKAVLEGYAASLGLSLEFGQPAVPSIG